MFSYITRSIPSIFTLPDASNAVSLVTSKLVSVYSWMNGNPRSRSVRSVPGFE